MPKKLNKEEMNADINRILGEAKEHGKLNDKQLADMRRGMEQLRDLCLMLDTACDELDAFAMGYTASALRKPGDDRLTN